jgi:hypothetical protein
MRTVNHHDLRALPEAVQDRVGYALNIAQRGGKHQDAKTLKGYGGAGVVEGRHILNIAYHLLTDGTIYRELGPSYVEQRRAEHLKRRCLDQLRNLGFQATLTPLQKAA